MSDICLYYIPESGPCRTVTLAAKLLNVKLNLKLVDLFKGEHITPEYLQLNPQHTVPTLKDGDFVLTESRAIITYLTDMYGKDDKLYPKDIKQRAKVLYLGSKSFDETHIPFIKTGFEHLNTFLKDNKYAAGDNLTLADIALVSTVDTALAVLDFDLKPYSNVERWFNYLKTTLPDYDDIMTKNSKKLRALVDSRKGKN